jgi:hypothetical protein
MLTFPFENNLLNDALNIVTATDEGFGRTITSLTVLNLGKDVAFTGEKVVIFPKGTSSPIYVTLTANMGSSTTMSFSSVETTVDIPEGSVILPFGFLKHKKINTTDLYFHQSLYLTTGTNGNDYLSAFGTSTFSVNSATDLADGDSKPNRWAAQFSIFVAPEICTLKKIKGWSSTDAGTGDDAVISIWSATPNAGTTTNLTIDLIHSFTITSRNNQNHLFDLEQDTSAVANAQLAEGDIIFVSIRRTGSKNSGVKWYADLGFDVEMNKNPI